ncbi:DUF4097 family beta strand repeat-containing protein [Tahibacter sp.]|uniref:DUF4097 family beta strand repeat-containing protein n=1 Tax=Tahibacter sp. TaxID=2056211 RepID=UPI0028C4750F|nr:DUF4097 family beta strand repeat-containing protein [Tahibacter sp.]
MRTATSTSVALRLAFAAGALVLLAACGKTPVRNETAATPAAEPPYTVERIKRDLILPDSVKHVRISNPHGSVGIKSIDNRTLGAYEVVQLIGETPEKPDIQMRIDGDSAIVEVSYASDRQLGTDRLVNGFRKGRVDLGMFLPAGPDLHVTTTYGDIQVRRVDNEVFARTRDGKLMVAGSGSIDAATDSGSLRVFPTVAKWRKPMKLHTRSGDILMEVPLYGEIQLDVETAGSIAGQVPLELRDAGKGRQHGQLRRAGGSQQIRVTSESGDIYLIPIDRLPQR